MAFFDPITKIFHGKEVPTVYSSYASLGQVLLFNFFKAPEKVIQVSDDDGISLTCADMGRMMTNIAKNLHKLGYRFGDVVGAIGRNTTFVTPALFSCFLLGLPVSLLDVSFDVAQIVQVFEETKPKLVFCDHDMIEKLTAAFEILNSNARAVVLTERREGLLHISNLLQNTEELIRL